jgi:hypothetical protein
MSGEEEKLREALRRAHAEDRPPPFHLPQATRRSASRRLQRWVVAGTLAAAATAALWLTIGRHPAAPPPQLAQWQAPLDFLLRTPGSELLATAPHFGTEEMPR